MMFVLDTNVLSAIISARGDPLVAAWISKQSVDLLFTTCICQAEILAGIATMPEGRRRRELEGATKTMFQEDFEKRLLPFDTEAAGIYADIFAGRRRAGRPTPEIDPHDREHRPRQTCMHRDA